MSIKNKTLIKEYVKILIKEFEDSSVGDVALSDQVGSPYGYQYGTKQDFYKIFVEPFVDAWGVAKGKTKEVASSVITLAKVIFQAILTSLIPIYKDSYEEIFEEEKVRIDKIKSEYSEIYKKVDQVFEGNVFSTIAFAYSPALFITTKLFKKGPSVALGLLSVLSGGSLDEPIKKFKNKLSRKKDEDEDEDFKKLFKRSSKKQEESLVRENEKDTEENNLEKSLSDFISSKQVKSIIANNQNVQNLSRDVQKIVHTSLNNVYSQAKLILNAKSLEEIAQKSGKNIPELNKLKSMSQQERSKIESDLLKNVKSSMKEFYVKQLESQVNSALKEGVPENHPYVNAYKKTIASIKSL